SQPWSSGPLTDLVLRVTLVKCRQNPEITEQQVLISALCFRYLNHDPHRIPTNISEAVCQTVSCTGVNENKDTMSIQPIQMDLLVLRKANKGNVFKIEVQKVTVGCTCVYA
uniref:Uncharacterized protein n=1 Tax=Leptobrachium leishanense TaxID=445787 RepID=A0A8C5MR82_9ANUR